MAAWDFAAVVAALAVGVVGGFDFGSVADALRSSDVLDVQEGSFRFLRHEDCHEILARRPASARREGLVAACSGTSPTTPHGLVMLPRGLGEEEDREDRCPLLCEGGLSAAWLLGAAEAVVLLGLTPPRCADFGLGAYLFSRLHPEGWTAEAAVAEDPAPCPAGPSRCELFASVSEPWGPRRLDLDRRFSAPFALVLSPSRAASRAAAGALAAAGVPSGVVHELPLPGRGLTLGLEAGADLLTSLFRVVSAQDEGSLTRYLADKPLRTFRLTLREPLQDLAADLFPTARFAVGRGLGGEARPRGALSMLEAGQELAALQRAVIAEAGRDLNFEYRIRVTEMSPRAPESGSECIARGLPCRADWPGSLHLASHALAASERECERLEESLRLRGSCRAVQRARLPLEDTDFMVVLGVNHKALGLAGHVSLAVHDLRTMEAVEAVEESELNGSALPYADPKREHRAKYLYALRFMRRCPATGRGARSCFSVPSSGPFSIPVDDPLHFVERSYGLLPGVASEHLVPPRVIHFAATGSPSQRKASGLAKAAAPSGASEDGARKQEI